MTEVGGKGKNLGRLHRHYFPVPNGGILTSRAYWDFLQYNGLSDLLRAAGFIKAEAVLGPANGEILTEIRRKIEEGRIPEIILEELAEKKVAAAVVIMELVPSVAAGVAFSCDPRTGWSDLLTMSANLGLGES